ncbi:DUF397 domain-containing protein [Streptomyces decoyicus]|uniref:DUF397 domain-containing protein n=1 Tax=Streptomyces decoyicus TaxID=249567 RepID=UPI003645DFDB
MSTGEPARLAWFKSSYSGNEGGACVEVAIDNSAMVHIRDSKEPAKAQLAFQEAQWAAFVDFAAQG